MHRTLKQETQPAAANRRAQQRAFDRFRHEYNEQRPHEALGILATITRATEGHVRWNGTDIASKPDGLRGEIDVAIYESLRLVEAPPPGFSVRNRSCI